MDYESVLSFHTPEVGILCCGVAMVASLQIEAKTSSTCDSCASFQLDEYLLHDWMWSASIVDFFPAHVLSFRWVRDGTVNMKI